jgi:hypothetical protein
LVHVSGSGGGSGSSAGSCRAAAGPHLAAVAVGRLVVHLVVVHLVVVHALLHLRLVVLLLHLRRQLRDVLLQLRLVLLLHLLLLHHGLGRELLGGLAHLRKHHGHVGPAAPQGGRG